MKFYTDTVSDELLEVLIAKGFQAKRIPIGFNTFYDGDGNPSGGYPEYGLEYPTYAEVLDWLFTNGYTISIGNVRGSTKWFALCPFIKDTNNMSDSFRETLEKVIFLALDLIENE
jgi:hypothetical protein